MVVPTGEQRRKPTLVTEIEHAGVRKRVKLVFAHHHFNSPKVTGRMSLSERVKAPSLFEPGEIMAAEELPEVVAAIRCPGGTTRFWPRGVTVARLVEYPELAPGARAQGDGFRHSPAEVIATGYAVCASMDNYEKDAGRHMALKDLLTSSSLSGAARHAVALCYTHRMPKGKGKGRKKEREKVPLVVENIDAGDEVVAR